MGIYWFVSKVISMLIMGLITTTVIGNYMERKCYFNLFCMVSVILINLINVIGIAIAISKI